MVRLPGNPALWLAAASILAAAAAWAPYLFRSGSPDESSLRDTDGIEITVLDVSPVGVGMEVLCRIKNQSKRAADSIVFTVSLVNPSGLQVSANPLGNAIHLPPGESCKVGILVPLPDGKESHSLTPHATVNLVRWGKLAKGDSFSD